MNVDPLLEVEQVTKTYHLPGQDVPALRGVDLRIDSPGFYAIMGPSGSGKSTLMHLCAAMDAPDTGSIRVAGTELSELDEAGRTNFRRRGMGIVFQQFNLVPTLTALDNVALPALLDGEGEASRNDRAMNLLIEMGLEDRANHRPDALSGGERQRVAIARSRIFNPPVLFADEPTGNLDSVSGNRLLQQLRGLVDERQTSVVMVTHEPEAAVHCDHIFVLRDGQFSEDFPVEDIDAAGVATRVQLALG